MAAGALPKDNLENAIREVLGVTKPEVAA